MMTETEKPKSRKKSSRGRERATHTHKKNNACYKDTEMKKVYENPRVHNGDVMRERDHVVVHSHTHTVYDPIFFPFLKRIPKKRSKC